MYGFYFGHATLCMYLRVRYLDIARVVASMPVTRCRIRVEYLLCWSELHYGVVARDTSQGTRQYSLSIRCALRCTYIAWSRIGRMRVSTVVGYVKIVDVVARNSSMCCVRGYIYRIGP